MGAKVLIQQYDDYVDGYCRERYAPPLPGDRLPSGFLKLDATPVDWGDLGQDPRFAPLAGVTVRRQAPPPPPSPPPNELPHGKYGMAHTFYGSSSDKWG